MLDKNEEIDINDPDSPIFIENIDIVGDGNQDITDEANQEFIDKVNQEFVDKANQEFVDKANQEIINDDNEDVNDSRFRLYIDVQGDYYIVDFDNMLIVDDIG